MMQVIVNGQDYHLAEGSTIAGLLTLLDVDGKLAVEINHSIIPRGNFASHTIHPGDAIEIIRAIGGG